MYPKPDRPNQISALPPSAQSDWSTEQVADFLSQLFSFSEPRAAMRFGLQRVAGILGAEAAGLLRDGELEVAVGLLAAALPLDRVQGPGPQTGTLDVEGAGTCHFAATAAEGEPPERLVVVRRGAKPFDNAEIERMSTLAKLLAAPAQALGALHSERTLRTHSEEQADENERLLDALGERQALLERLSRIQRAIVDRQPSQTVLDAIVLGAADLLREDVAVLRLVDGTDPGWMSAIASLGVEPRSVGVLERCPIAHGLGGRAIRERRVVSTTAYADEDDALPILRQQGLKAAIAAPVWEGETVIGSLEVGSFRRERPYTQSEQGALKALAEHASMALADARNFEAAVHRAFHDLLTDLPNRALFLDRLEQARRRAERAGTLIAVLFCDLDGFKRVNDSLGHAAGDELLIEVAGRLEDCLRPTDTAARFGGDEFAILLENLESASDATMIASRIMSSLEDPIPLQGRRVTVTASIGIAMQRDGNEDLLRDADLAMYRAKGLGKSRYEVFDPILHSEAMERLRLETELQKAVDNDEFRLEFQPIVDIATGSIAAVETLIRWQHPDQGLLYPNDFIGIAEETRLISAIGRWVLNEACLQGVRWQRRFPSAQPLAITVNLSVTQLQQPGLIYEVAESLERSGLPASSLILEITETLLMDNVEMMADTLTGLKELGVGLAVDDFGTGYSSLQYLRRFPIDVLKIAKPFVDGIASSDGSVLARVILDLGQSLDLHVIAEGIEDPSQVDELQRMGCRFAQGFHYARPVRGAEIDRLLAKPDAIMGWPTRTGDGFGGENNEAEAASPSLKLIAGD